MLHQPAYKFTAPDAGLAQPRDDRNLIKLCQRAEALLAADLAACNHDSTLDDAFMMVDKPERPTMPSDLPGGYSHMSSSELRNILRTMRAKPAKERTTIAAGILAGGHLAEYAHVLAAWEKQIGSLKDRHGLKAARRVRDKATARTFDFLPKIVEVPARTIAGLAAKCRVMKAALEAGYGHDGVFDDLAGSIYENGALLSDAPRTARPRSSDVGHPAHI